MFEFLIATFLVVAAFLWHSTVRVLDLPAGSRTFRIILGLVLIGAMIYGIVCYVDETKIVGWMSALLNVSVVLLGLLSACVMALMLRFIEDSYHIAIVRNAEIEQEDEKSEPEAAADTPRTH